MLATAASAYYEKSRGAFQFMSVPLSIEDEEPCRRVALYLENLTDNCEFYGVYRREAMPLEVPNIMGGDWISMIDTAFRGKIKVIDGATIHRMNHWDNAERWSAVATASGLPQAQARHPHYATALAALLHIALGAPAYRALTDAQRVRLALQAFRLFRKNQRLPRVTRFWPDCREFFGEALAREKGHALRRLLADLCARRLGEAASADAPGEVEVLELAFLLALWTEPMTPKEREDLALHGPALDMRREALAAYAYHALFKPAYKQPRFFGLGEMPHTLLIEYLGYATAHEELFEADEDIEACVAHLQRMIESLIAGAAPPTVRYVCRASA